MKRKQAKYYAYHCFIGLAQANDFDKQFINVVLPDGDQSSDEDAAAVDVEMKKLAKEFELEAQRIKRDGI